MAMAEVLPAQRVRLRVLPPDQAIGVPHASTEFGDFVAARAYGRRAAPLLGFRGRTWDDVAPLLRTGWAGYHGVICATANRHDWRSGWPGVKDGWMHYQSLSSTEHAV